MSERRGIIVVEQFEETALCIATFEPIISVRALKNILTFLSDAQRLATTPGKSHDKGLNTVYHALGRTGSFETVDQVVDFTNIQAS